MRSRSAASSVNVYAAALYVEETSRDAAAILASRQTKLVQVAYLYDVSRTDVVRAFKEALARDKTRTQVFDISELGLVEMTRKRISEGLVESLSETCPTCNGRGIILDQTLLS